MTEPLDKYQITDLGVRDVSILTKLKKHCTVCKKETNQELLFIYERLGYPIGLPLWLPLTLIHGRKTYPEFLGYRCQNCGNTFPLDLDIKKKAELTTKYHTDSIPKNEEKIKVVG